MSHQDIQRRSQEVGEFVNKYLLNTPSMKSKNSKDGHMSCTNNMAAQVENQLEAANVQNANESWLVGGLSSSRTTPLNIQQQKRIR